MKNKMKNNKEVIARHNLFARSKTPTAGITLIALVITIIVLLILAGISIAMLTGENGILTKAQIASQQTKQQGALEKVKIAVASSYEKSGLDIQDLKNNLKNIEGIDLNTIQDNLPMTVSVDSILINIYNNGKVEMVTKVLQSTENTKPYLPSGEFEQVEGTDLDTGLVIKDKNGNSFVWIEVPKNIFATAKTDSDYNNIEKDMQTYAADYRAIYTDTWYEGCGLLDTEYNNLKQTMLKSVYNNGGFWISQYEIGTDKIRTSTQDEFTEPLSKEKMYAYNYVTVEQAEKLAKQMNSGNFNSSLMFGIQWDLIMKCLEEKGAKTKAQISTNSGEWGNYNEVEFELTKGKYSLDNGVSYIEIDGNYTKMAGEKNILTTGATSRNSTLNIYDLAGNVYEWTLEKSSSSTEPSVRRGGYYKSKQGAHGPVSHRVAYKLGDNDAGYGFRTAIY